ncbi:amino acid permease [Candidatus Woesearchaeota archaeon]|nr:amino acid permease [Candidatus Woesearchaeota archaeon]
MNLKGTRESGIAFSIPTYFFIISFLVMILIGFMRYFTGTLTPAVVDYQLTVVSGASVFFLLRAFSSGCVALTGIEAVSNGVLAFKKDESKNAVKTLFAMAILLSVLFFGITFLSIKMNIVPSLERTVVSIIAENLFGKTMFFYVLQACTMLILFLAANTSFADFPRLCFFLAKDNYLPNQFKRLGDRLVFSNGIMFLGLSASLLLVLFGASVHNLIPLYAVGVFTSFTLSQAGMTKRHFALKSRNWRLSALVNILGTIMSFTVLIIIAVSKFTEGAWIIIILIPIFVFIFKKIHGHYTNLAGQLSVADLKKIRFKKEKHLLIVLVPSFHKGIIKALNFAKTFSDKVIAVHFKLTDRDTENVLKYWKKFNVPVKLDIVDSPYRTLISPLNAYLDRIEKRDPNLQVIVIIPEFVPKKGWHHFLHNQTGLALKTNIHFRKRTSFISIQYHLEK